MTPIQFMKEFMRILTEEGNSEDKFVTALKELTTYSDIDSIKDDIHNDVATAASPQVFLRDYCGIDFTNKDVGALIGHDVSNHTYLSENDVIDESYIDLKIAPPSSEIYGLNVILPVTTAEKEIFICNALYSWWFPLAMALIHDSYGLIITSTSRADSMTVSFIKSPASGGAVVTAYSAIAYDSSTYVPVSIGIVINMHNDAYGSIDTTNPNGYSPTLGSSYLDRIIAHEMVHLMMATNIWGMHSNDIIPHFLIEGCAELVHGCDDTRQAGLISCVTDLSEFDDGFEDSPSNDLHWYTTGYIVLRYLLKKFAERRGDV